MDKATPVSLVLDMVEWISTKTRTYDEVMEAWRTSCPRLSVWEDAVDAGYVIRHRATEGEQAGQYVVDVTQSGQEFLRQNRPQKVA